VRCRTRQASGAVAPDDHANRVTTGHRAGVHAAAMFERRTLPNHGQLAAPPHRRVLFVNPRSGGGAARRVGRAERARELGVDVIEFAAGQRFDDMVATAIDEGAIALG